MKSFNYKFLGLGVTLIVATFSASCGGKNGPKLPGGLGDLPKMCGLVCPGDTDENGVKVAGVLDGNANISGVASLDAFFASVVKFNGAAANVSGGIDAQLDLIKADFGLEGKGSVAAELKAKLDANLDGKIDGGLKVDYTPAKCAVDAHATLEAQAKCDASVDPGKASVQCEGSCSGSAMVEADCSGGAEVQCTVTDPSVMCGGTCEGSCTLDVDASGKCGGTCEGTCEGDCSVKNTDGSCSGSCSGKCSGTCKAELEADGSCMAHCSGSCTATPPSGMCSAEAKVSCKAKAGAKVECKGSCDGDFEPPKAKAECEASAKADASVNVQCTPPQLDVSYKLAASLQGSANIAARAKFESALKLLFKSRLPALLAATAKAKFVARAGENLVTAASGAVKGSVDAAADAAGSGNIKVVVGLTCAGKELPKVKDALDVSTSDLKASLSASADITGALGLGG